MSSGTDTDDLSDNGEQWSDDTDILIRHSHDRRHRKTRQVRLYKRRWLMLSIFCLNSMMNAVIWISLSSINDITSKYYKVDPAVIDWMANLFLLVYVFAALPATYFMTCWGLRPTMVVGASFNAVATALHFAGCGRNGFPFVVCGQIFAAIAFATILQVPGRLSAVWFGSNERSVATSLGVSMNTFGVAVGFLQPTHMVPQSHDMSKISDGFRLLSLCQMCVCVFLLFTVYSFFEEEPPTPIATSGSIAGEDNGPSFMESLRILSRDSQFNILAQSYGLYFGMYCSFSVLLNELVAIRFPEGYEGYIGWMGFGCDAIAIVSMFILGLILDKFHIFRSIAIFLNLASLTLMFIFLLVLIRFPSFPILFVDYILLGAFGIPFFATGIEQVAEMTYPIQEGTSSAIILIIGNLYGFFMILLLGTLIEQGQILIAGGFMLGFYVISTILAICVRTSLRRTEIERDLNSGSSSQVRRRFLKELSTLAGSFADV